MIEVKVKPEQIIFFDIETVPLYTDPIAMAVANPQLSDAMLKRAEKSEGGTVGDFWKQIGLFPEFSRIACISAGIIDTATGKFKIKSYKGDEKGILIAFSKDLALMPKRMAFVCGHNIKNFDIPFIIKRSVVNGLPLPEFCKIYGKKPWEMGNILDTMEIWSCGAYGAKTSLETLAAVFDLPNPKEHTMAHSVAQMWELGMVDEICSYCEADILTTANVYAMITGNELVGV